MADIINDVVLGLPPHVDKELKVKDFGYEGYQS